MSADLSRARPTQSSPSLEELMRRDLAAWIAAKDAIKRAAEKNG